MDKPEMIFGRDCIKISIKCPKCDCIHKADIKIIKTTCPKCKETFEKDITVESELQACSFLAYIILKELKTNDEIDIYANDRHLFQAEDMIKNFKTVGIKIKCKERVTKKDDNGKRIDVNKITITKEDFLKCFEDNENGNKD